LILRFSSDKRIFAQRNKVIIELHFLRYNSTIALPCRLSRATTLQFLVPGRSD